MHLHMLINRNWKKQIKLKLIKAKNINVLFVDIFMILKKEIPTQELNPELHLKISPATGNARYAVYQKMISRKSINLKLYLSSPKIEYESRDSQACCTKHY